MTKKTSQQATAQDYYEIYKKLQEGEKRKGVERKSSFSSQENRRESSNISRSKSFSAYSIKNRKRVDDPVDPKSDDWLKVREDQADNNNMLEQTSQRPPEIKVTGGIAERYPLPLK